MLIFFVAYDILWSLFYIIDYNDYVAKKFYLVNGLVMLCDTLLRFCFVTKEFHWFRDVRMMMLFDCRHLKCCH